MCVAQQFLLPKGGERKYFAKVFSKIFSPKYYSIYSSSEMGSYGGLTAGVWADVPGGWLLSVVSVQ